jgi:hypothetical protein
LLVCLILGAISIVAVGSQQLIAYPRYVLGLEKTMALGAIMPSDMPNLRGVLYLMAAGCKYFEILVVAVSAALYLWTAWICALAEYGSQGGDPQNCAGRDLKFALAVFATVLVSYHGLGYDLCLLALPLLLIAGQLVGKISLASWPGIAIVTGMAALLFSPLQLVLLMRYNHLAFLGWAVLLCFVGLATTGLRSRALPT